MRENRERATWTHEKEEALLQLYTLARRNDSLRGEHGLRHKGWAWIADEMAERFGGAKDKSILQSKMARLGREFRLHRWARRQPGVRVTDHGKLDVNEADWENLVSQRRNEHSVLRRFRTIGFQLTDQCAAAFEDEDTLKESGTSIDSYLTNVQGSLSVKRSRPSSPDSTTQDRRPKSARYSASEASDDVSNGDSFDMGTPAQEGHRNAMFERPEPPQRSAPGRLLSERTEQALCRFLEVATLYLEHKLHEASHEPHEKQL
ncbi:hypothetical protein PINS_up000250 [Pythium insidiosum]|nr:hypothetical protein PINS_up000250 [Pythium insidiosum]